MLEIVEFQNHVSSLDMTSEEPEASSLIPEPEAHCSSSLTPSSGSKVGETTW